MGFGRQIKLCFSNRNLPTLVSFAGLCSRLSLQDRLTPPFLPDLVYVFFYLLYYSMPAIFLTEDDKIFNPFPSSPNLYPGLLQVCILLQATLQRLPIQTIYDYRRCNCNDIFNIDFFLWPFPSPFRFLRSKLEPLSLLFPCGVGKWPAHTCSRPKVLSACMCCYLISELSVAGNRDLSTTRMDPERFQYVGQALTYKRGRERRGSWEFCIVLSVSTVDRAPPPSLTAFTSTMSFCEHCIKGSLRYFLVRVASTMLIFFVI